MNLLLCCIAIISLLSLIALVWDALETREGMNFWGSLSLAVLLLVTLTIAP